MLVKTDTPTDLNKVLATSLQALQQAEVVSSARRQDTVHVQNIGNVLSSAYEQLRNASENIEDHLLFQRAILRFYKRNLSLINRQQPVGLGGELIVELTQAAYLKNDTVSRQTAERLDVIIAEYYEAYWQLADATPRIPRETAQAWVLQLLSVASEHVFNDPLHILSFAHLAQTHFAGLMQVADHVVEGELIDARDYPKLLYMAIHRALLKSDEANIRTALATLYGVKPSDTDAFIAFNYEYDRLAATKTVTKLARIVSRNGAPLRMIRSTFFESEIPVDPMIMSQPGKVMARIDGQIDEEYRQVKKRLNTGTIKSIIFLLITKALIGLLIEIPYDIAVYGVILFVPLAINLLFPPLFIAITALTFKLPTPANKVELLEYIDTMLFVQDTRPPLAIKTTQPTGKSHAFNIVYGLMFIVAFYLVADRLVALQFNIVQGAIFFIFLSTASFLGYRLTLQVKELELVTTNQGGIALIRDFLYAPFIFVGQHISYRFSKMNIIAQILDMVIELPLKTILRLLRQWTVFLNNKKDELL